MIIADWNIKFSLWIGAILSVLLAKTNKTKTPVVVPIEAELASLLAISGGWTILLNTINAKSLSDIDVYLLYQKSICEWHVLETKYPALFSDRGSSFNYFTVSVIWRYISDKIHWSVFGIQNVDSDMQQAVSVKMRFVKNQIRNHSVKMRFVKKQIRKHSAKSNSPKSRFIVSLSKYHGNKMLALNDTIF